MGENSKIEWTTHTFNPWIGCTKVSPACAHCYAENATPVRVARAAGVELWVKGNPRKRNGPEASETADWDDTLLRHAYGRGMQNKVISLCGYAGPSTWKSEGEVPANVCPICLALLMEIWDPVKKQWID